MKPLTDNLKRILSGLAYQDAGEFQTMDEKMALLGYGSEAQPPSRPRPVKRTTRRIAFITDGRGKGAPLEFAIDAANRSEASIDLLVHSVRDEASLVTLEQRIRTANLACRRVPLDTRAAEGIEAYVANNPSLIYLVAMPDDAPVKRLLEEVLPGRGRRMPVPMVLVDDCAPAWQTSRSAA